MTNQMLQDSAHSLSKKYSPDVPIAERYSIEVALEILAQNNYEALRSAISPDDSSKIKLLKVRYH